MNEEKARFLAFFNEVCTREGLTYRRVLERINDHYSIPEGTFKDSIDRSKPNLNCKAVMAFCKTFGYDIYQIYRDRAENTLSYPASAGSAAIDPELPDSFYGRFYGYLFRRTAE